MSRFFPTLIFCARSPSISSTSATGSITTPLPMTHVFSGRKMPDGIRCSTYFLPPVMTVWPALLPPCERTTMSAFSVRKSMILPLPSSPHWAPTRIVFAIFWRVLVGKKTTSRRSQPAGRNRDVGGYYRGSVRVQAVSERRKPVARGSRHRSRGARTAHVVLKNLVAPVRS